VVAGVVQEGVEAKLATRTALKRSRDELKRMIFVQAAGTKRAVSLGSGRSDSM